MNEAEWLAATDPRPMLEALGATGKASDRKLRLFAVACCRRIWHLLTDENSRRSVEVAELYAEGMATEEERGAAWRLAFEVVPAMPPGGPGPWAAMAAERALAKHQEWWWRQVADTAEAAASAFADDSGVQAALLRDSLGPVPSRTPPIDPAWLAWNSGTVVRLAEDAYARRSLPAGHLDSARLGVLADALEDAGCQDAQILGHLRGPGPHVRGCYIVDLLLGKE
jgi:hypothetical protein